MGKNGTMIKYIDISGFDINQPNRGNAALSYGAISFLFEKGYLKEDHELIKYRPYLNIFKSNNLKPQKNNYIIAGKKWVFNQIPVFILEKILIEKCGIILPFTFFGRTIKQVEIEAADYGGDGFSDIYGTQSFLGRMHQTFMLQKAHVPLIMLPQTIGPFTLKSNFDIAVKIMRYAKKIYVRDGKFCSELEQLGLQYTLTKDLSAYMQPEPWKIKINPKPVGLNVSGLAYFNIFNGLEGQFDAYPELVDRIINHFRSKGCTVYLIPHSYNYLKPDNQDDMLACREAFKRLEVNSNVILVDKDLTAPQVKYLISKMSFFIGGRMHANFAAIYSNVPVFGTAYSYKFQGAFEANGLDGKKQTARLNNLKKKDIPSFIEKIDIYYNESCSL